MIAGNMKRCPSLMAYGICLLWIGVDSGKNGCPVIGIDEAEQDGLWREVVVIDPSFAGFSGGSVDRVESR